MSTFHRIKSRYLRITVAILLCLFIQACSQVSFLMQSKPEKVATMMEQHRFYPALDLIDATAKEDPDYQQLMELRGKVLTAITDYEKERLRTSGKLIAKGELREAQLLIEEALTRVPASKELMAKRKSNQRAIDRHVTATQLDLAQLRAQSLPREIELLEKMQRYTADNNMRQSLEEKRLEVDAARQLLIDEANRLIKRGNMDEARHNASLAQAIHKGKDSQQLLDRIERSLQAGKLDRLRQAIDDKDLLLAQRIAKSLTGKDREEKNLLKMLRQKVELEVLQLTREGQHAYTTGDLDKAIERWELALRLDPDNGEIKNLLQRARTFKTNYQRFKTN